MIPMYELVFGLGAILILISFLGAGLEIKEVRLPKLTSFNRILAAILGIVFTGLGLWLWNLELAKETPDQPPPSESQTKSPASEQAAIDKSKSGPSEQTESIIPTEPLKTETAKPASETKAMKSTPPQENTPMSGQIKSIPIVPQQSVAKDKTSISLNLIDNGFELPEIKLVDWNLGTKRDGRRGTNGFQAVYLDKNKGSSNSK